MPLDRLPGPLSPTDPTGTVNVLFSPVAFSLSAPASDGATEVVDDFIDRVMADARLNANPRVDEDHHRVSVAGFTYLVTEMVC